MPEMILAYICPQCGWSSRVRYIKKHKIMVCGHCPFEGPPRDFEKLVPVDEDTGEPVIKGNSDPVIEENT